MTDKYLVTTDCWFHAPDGSQYKAAWGSIEILGDDFLGIKTNRNSTNWYAKIGSEEKHIIVAGCQIHYAVKCNEKPNTGNAKSWESNAEVGIKEFERPCSIYIAE